MSRRVDTTAYDRNVASLYTVALYLFPPKNSPNGVVSKIFVWRGGEGKGWLSTEYFLL